MVAARLGGRRRAPRPAPWRRALALGVPIALAALALLPLPPAHALSVTPPRPVGAVATSLSFSSAPSDPVISSAFWGANLRPYYALGSTQSQTFDASGLSYVRWPGGAIADRLNVTANLIYNDNGTSYAPPTSSSAFVSWCQSVGCRAIVGLPGEIDRPATAAYYVAYYEKTLGFTPAYFEIGNEPSVWTHYGTSWSGWNVSQATNATPVVYANLVHAYIAAIRSVDPIARFIGLPGLGTGAWGEPTWIRASVRLNGPNLSAVAIHVYPAGFVTGTNGTLAQFYATLGSNSSLGVRVPPDRAAITAACPRCSIDLVASELGSGTAGGPFNSWMDGYAVVPYLAEEFEQAIALNLTNVDLFALQSSYGGSLLTPTGNATNATTLYHEMLSRLLPRFVPSTLSVSANGVSALVTRNVATTSFAILVVNTNLTVNATLALNARNQTLVTGARWTWNATSSAPLLLSWVGAVPPLLHLGPESVALILLNESITTSHATLWNLAGGVPPGLAIPTLSAASLLGLAAPTSLTFPCWAVAQRERRRLAWARRSPA